MDARTGFGTRTTQTRIPTGTTSAATLDDYDMKSMPYVRRLKMETKGHILVFLAVNTFIDGRDVYQRNIIILYFMF